MEHTHRPLRTAAQWIAFLALVSVLAFSLTVGVSNLSAMQPAACQPSASRLLYVGLNNWIPAEPRSGCAATPTSADSSEIQQAAFTPEPLSSGQGQMYVGLNSWIPAVR